MPIVKKPAEKKSNVTKVTAVAKKPAAKAKPVTKEKPTDKQLEKVVKKVKTGPAKKSIVNAAPTAYTPGITETTSRPVAKTKPKKATKPVVVKPVAKKAAPKEEVVKPIRPKKMTAAVQAAVNPSPAPVERPSHRLVPAVAMHRQDSRALNSFSNEYEAQFNVNGGVFMVPSGFLRMHRSVNLLELSAIPNLIADGVIRADDELDSVVKLVALNIEVDGVDRIVSMRPDDHVYINKDSDQPQLLAIETTVVLKVAIDGEERNSAIRMTGNVDTISGRSYLTGVCHPKISLKGYQLSANRKVKI